MKKPSFKGKKIAVVGLARSGLAASLLLKKLGAEVWVTESGQSKEILKNARLLKNNFIKHIEAGNHSDNFIKGKDLVVTSPGVSNTAKPIALAKKYNIPIISEIELGWLACPAPIIAVTGSNGKSTVTTLIGAIFKKAGLKTFICGNIGRPFCSEVEKVAKNDIVILEISSFQLEYIDKFRPKVGIILNISQNHLDRYNNFSEYIQAKRRIFKNQGKDDFAILNYDDGNLKKLSRDIKSNILFFSRSQKTNIYLQDNFIYLNNKKFCSFEDVKIKGRHNLENAMVCILAAKIFRINEKIIKTALKTFKGLEHRLEYVRNVRGVDFINDSKATSVGATIAALQSFSKPVILIAGGRDKGSNFSVLGDLIPNRVKGLVLVGEAKKIISQSLEGLAPIKQAPSFSQAVKMAYQMANGGETVLLSPMCASFDMFGNFEERGRVFKKIVGKIKK